MTDYVSTALFVYTKDIEDLSTRLQKNSFGVEVTPVTYDAFVQDPAAWLEG
ncbi:MAG: hypothetical protein GY807_23950, partial [Gammaproteobacteria bacterium]|nr:hypothetical protein [Gammaproteobacteria bacterium]